MAKNISLMGASYSDVPAVLLPQTGGGTARFDDASVTTATASDVAQGKVFIAEDGTITEGTAPVSVEKKEVNFFDYDGTVLYSYTAEEAAELTELPDNPGHDGLIAQGWNYTLAEIQTEVADHGLCDIGQMYITDDGVTRLYCVFEKGRLTPYFGICPNGSVTIDWGDGTATSTVTGTSLTTAKVVSHTYSASGSYVISLTVNSGEFAFAGEPSVSYLMRKSVNTVTNANKVYMSTVRRVRLGSGVRLSNYAFFYAGNLESITMPDSITSISSYAFAGCYSLPYITIPSGITSLGDYAFSGGYAMKDISIPATVSSFGAFSLAGFYGMESISIPSGATSFGEYLMQNCQNLTRFNIPSGITVVPNCMVQFGLALSSMTVPSGVTEIKDSAFDLCNGMAEYHMLPTTVPTLETVSVFGSKPPDCLIYVPKSSGQTILNAYKTAANWSSFASFMREEP